MVRKSRASEPKGITLESQGGIGNQLFIYSLARALQFRSYESVRIDTWRHNLPRARAYQISPLVQDSIETVDTGFFGINSPTSIGGSLQPIMSRLTRSRKAFSERVQEQSLEFDPRFLHPEPGMRLCGYFQSWKYFDDIADALRQELQTQADHLLRNVHLRQGLPGAAVHVRLGDYLKRKHRATHQIDRESYYERALSHVIQLERGTTFTIFSDDPDSAQELLRRYVPADNLLVFPSTDSDLLDLLSMSRFSRIICANSTFSWWAAWMSGLPGDRILVPSHWINRPDFKLEDLVPPDWTRF